MTYSIVFCHITCKFVYDFSFIGAKLFIVNIYGKLYYNTFLDIISNKHPY